MAASVNSSWDAARTTKPKATKLQDALEIGEHHFNTLPVSA
jgi:hypothetical protein